MSVRRMLRLTRKRAFFLAFVALLYVGFLVYGRTFVTTATENVLRVLPDDGAMEKELSLVNPLTSRVVVSSLNASNEDVQKSNATLLPTQGKERVNTDVIKESRDEETEFLLRMEEVQKSRHDLIRRRCEDTYNITRLVDFDKDREKILSWKSLYEHAYANDDYRFIICRVLKVGSFSWRKVIRSLHTKGSAAFRKKQAMGDYPMRDYDDETFLRELRNYTKILYVREPFARLLSGYRDKYVELRHFPYYKPIGSKIIQEFRKGASKREIASGKPSFEEFVRWLVKNPEDRSGDYHWRPLFDWYHPCELHYDYIGKLETASEDARYIFKKIGIDKVETYPSTETHHKFSSAKDVLKLFYSQLPAELLPKIIYRYREEFVLFNYTIPKTFSDIWA